MFSKKKKKETRDLGFNVQAEEQKEVSKPSKGKKKTKSNNKKKKSKPGFTIPKTVQETIPYLKLQLMKNKWTFLINIKIY